jgi:hypothetical protein
MEMMNAVCFLIGFIVVMMASFCLLTLDRMQFGSPHQLETRF